MTPNRDGKPVVPGRDSYDIEFVEVTGPPTSMSPMPPAKSRGKLTPLGTGEGVPQRPGPGAFLRKRVPLVPTREEIEGLPRWSKVAFAERCARRVVPAFKFFWKEASVDLVLAVDGAVKEATAAHTDAVAAVRDALKAAFIDAAHAAARDAASAAYNAAHGVADAAVRAIFEAATTDSPLTAQLRCIRRDFTLLKKLARKENWTDDTPVPPEVFGPMWPDGIAPYWAVEPPQPPTP